MNLQFRKITADEQNRLELLRSRTEGRYLRALNAFLAQTQSDATLRRVIDLLEDNRLTEVMNLVDRHISVLANTLPDRFREVAGAETAAIQDAVMRVIPDTTAAGIGFDPTHERAARLMQQNRLEFVQNYGAQQRDVTRQAIQDSLRTGAGPRAAAREFRDTMGLTPGMVRAVNNYERLLRTQSRDALNRDLRDRRYDRTVGRSINQEVVLTEDQIQRMVARYRKRMEIWRSEMIARTETSKTLGLARMEAMRQAHSQAGIPDNWVRREWSTSMDGRERATHHEMDGQIVYGMDSSFLSPSGARLRFPGDPTAPAAEIINCRCDYSITYRAPTVAAVPPPPSPEPPAVGLFPASQTNFSGLPATNVMHGMNDQILKMFGTFADVPEARLTVQQTMTGGPNTTNAMLMGPDGLFINRYFERAGRLGKWFVKHDHFELPKSMQGKGVAKPFMRDSMNFYEAIGVDEISIFADIDVGSYAWAKYGFAPRDIGRFGGVKNHIMTMLRYYDDRGFIISDAARATIERVYYSSDPQDIWAIADLSELLNGVPLGKRLLMNVSWGGSLRLDDSAAMKRFRDYVG